jgi:hypothetical protein
MESYSKSVKYTDTDCGLMDDTHKRAKLHDITLLDMLESITNVTTLLRDQPSLWSTNEFSSVRRFVREISSQPSVYPPSTNDQRNDTNEIIHHDCSLSNDFVSSIYKDSVRSRSDIDYDPVLNVQSISSRYRICHFEYIMGAKYESKQITCIAGDKTNNMLRIKISTQMTSYNRLIKTGNLIKISDFRTIFYDNDHQGIVYTTNIYLYSLFDM